MVFINENINIRWKYHVSRVMIFQSYIKVDSVVYWICVKTYSFESYWEFLTSRMHHIFHHRFPTRKVTEIENLIIISNIYFVHNYEKLHIITKSIHLSLLSKSKEKIQCVSKDNKRTTDNFNNYDNINI